MKQNHRNTQRQIYVTSLSRSLFLSLYQFIIHRWKRFLFGFFEFFLLVIVWHFEDDDGRGDECVTKSALFFSLLIGAQSALNGLFPRIIHHSSNSCIAEPKVAVFHIQNTIEL